MTELITPETALIRFLDYTRDNVITSVIISADIDQRMRLVGNITFNSENKDSLELIEVHLPNWVAKHVRDIVTYPLAIERQVIDE